MSEKKRVLVVDDELNIRRILQASLDKAGFHTIVSESAEAALEAMEDQPADCVLTDVTMPGMDGYELQRTVRGRWPEVPVIIMTAFGTIPQAVQSIRDGAFEYVTKPFDLEVVKKIVKAALKGTPSAGKPKKPADARSSKTFVAESPSMVEVVETIRQVADSRATILITGESGTGKEIVGRLIHDYSRRADGPYVAVSCAALPETLLESELFGYVKGAFTGADRDKAGRFETADKGTLFLDEIGDIPVTTQVKLLRVLQEREIERLGAIEPTPIDVRLVAATNRNLSSAVEDGKFRLDLLYRLQVVEIDIPPLRQRPEDVRPLAMHFLAKFSQENERDFRDVSEEALAVMRRYAWPGNVRELENAMERAVVLAEHGHRELTLAHLPRQLREAA
ncbi:MAG: sigma-54-dependent Fis family transcriptional regulator [Armatimonadetes bacterium]|nr:sigma-54-dependent Fis family transcriptional regulator [Armatimonadota bacterium]